MRSRIFGKRSRSWIVENALVKGGPVRLVWIDVDKSVHINNPKPLLKEERIPCRRGSFAQSFQDYAYFGAFVAGKVREVAIAREVGDSVLYHALFELASPQDDAR